jgi:ATP-binding cassette subfamily B protein
MSRIAEDEIDDDAEADGTASDGNHTPHVPVRTIFRRFWPDTRPFRGRMLLSLLLVPLPPALTAAGVYLFKVLVDDVLTPHDYRLFLPVAAAYLAITAVGGLVGFADEYLTAWVGERFVTGLRVRLFAHLQRVSVGWFERHQLGDVLTRLTEDVAAIEQLVLTGVNMTLTYAFQVLFFAGTLASFVAAPAFLLLARTFSSRIQSASRERRRRSGSITAVAEENLANLALVQAYDRGDAEVERFAEENRGAFAAQMLALRLEALFEPFSGLVEAVGLLVVMGAAVYELAQGAITLGGLLAFLTFLTQLYGPVQGFAGLSNTLYTAAAGAERILELLDQEPGVPEAEHPRPLDRAVGVIGFEGVGFAYPGAARPSLRNVSLRLPPGSKVAIVGPSGAGKSTLTKLLLRSYDPDRGRITLDGLDLRSLALSDLRRNVSAVLQESLVLDGTVAENIRWGKPDATDDEVRAAAMAADAHEFIERLDHGYATRVGQRGRPLSGGQRQRIAIARAMIRDAPVLLLDEPTTGLDAASGQRVLAPLRRLMAGRTTIIISHDLLTVTDADAIIVLEAGAVSAVGTHEQLLATSPTYAQLHALHQPGSRAPARGPDPMPSAPRRGPAPVRGVSAQAGRVRRGPPDATVPLAAVIRRPPPAAMPRMPFAAPRPTRPAPAPPSTAGSGPRHRAAPVEAATEALPVAPAAARPPMPHREVSPDPVRARATT